MKEKKSNVGGIIAAAFLTIFLIPMMLLTTTLSSLSAVLSSDGLQQILESIDYRELARKDDGFDEMLEDSDLDGGVVSEFMSTDFVADLSKVYVSDLIAAMEDPDAEAELDANMLEELADEHMDELTRIVRDVVKDQTDEEISKAEARELIEEGVDEYGEELLDSLPDVTELELQELGEGPVGYVLDILLSDALLWGMVLLTVLLEVLVGLCLSGWIRRCTWIGVVNLVPAVLLLTAGVALPIVVDSMLSSAEILLVEPVARIVADKLLLAALIMAVIGVVCIAARFVMKWIEKRKAGKPGMPVMPGV